VAYRKLHEKMKTKLDTVFPTHGTVVLALAFVVLTGAAVVSRVSDHRSLAALAFGLALLDSEILALWLAHRTTAPGGSGSDPGPVRSHIEHEDILINNRLTWLTGLQALLFAGYVALSTSQSKGKEFSHRAQQVLPWAGLVSTIVVTLSIVAALAAIESLKTAHETSKCDHTNHLGVTSKWPIHFLGLAAPLTLPALLTFGWILVLSYR
jgi:hypothetical protein